MPGAGAIHPICCWLKTDLTAFQIYVRCYPRSRHWDVCFRPPPLVTAEQCYLEKFFRKRAEIFGPFYEKTFLFSMLKVRKLRDDRSDTAEFAAAVIFPTRSEAGHGEIGDPLCFRLENSGLGRLNYCYFNQQNLS